MKTEAVNKLREELKSGTFAPRANVMKDAVCQALESFCRQDEEFAQAVGQGGTFTECMRAVEKAVKGQAISDIDAFTEAVRFYFPGAGIRVEMTIDLCADVCGGKPTPETKSAGIVLDLLDFL